MMMEIVAHGNQYEKACLIHRENLECFLEAHLRFVVHDSKYHVKNAQEVDMEVDDILFLWRKVQVIKTFLILQKHNH